MKKRAIVLQICLTYLLIAPLEARAAVIPTLIVHRPSNSTLTILSVSSTHDSAWVKNLHIDIKNTGTKPIYFARLVVRFPQVDMGSGKRLIFDVTLGDSAFMDFSHTASPGDLYLPPNQTITLTVPGMKYLAYKKMLENMSIALSSVDTAEIHFQQVNFGDMSGNVNGRVIMGGNDTGSCECDTRYSHYTNVCQNNPDCSRFYYSRVGGGSGYPCGSITTEAEPCIDLDDGNSYPCDVQRFNSCWVVGGTMTVTTWIVQIGDY